MNRDTTSYTRHYLSFGKRVTQILNVCFTLIDIQAIDGSDDNRKATVRRTAP